MIVKLLRFGAVPAVSNGKQFYYVVTFQTEVTQFSPTVLYNWLNATQK